MRIPSALATGLAQRPFEWIERTTIGHRAKYSVVDPKIYWSVLGDIAREDRSSYRDRLPSLWRWVRPQDIPTTYLDVAASGQMLLPVYWTFEEALGHYGNDHGSAHPKARAMTDSVEEVHRDLLRFTHADPSLYTSVFGGSGATFMANLTASLLPEDRKVVLSEDAHHASIVPWQIRCENDPKRLLTLPMSPTTFTADPATLDDLLARHAHQVGWVIITAASNVDGHINPVADLVKVAHRHGVKIAVDVAAYAAHAPIDLEAWNRPDAIYGSGHKMDAPASPGWGVFLNESLDRTPTIGGGAQVVAVGMKKTLFTKNLQHLWEPGTKNLLGILMLGAALRTFEAVGMSRVREHESRLISFMLRELGEIGAITLYGETDSSKVPRVGIATFGVKGMDHDVVARILADYFNIHVRAGCFCSHPQVERFLGIPPGEVEVLRKRLVAGEAVDIPGLIRASMGVYTNIFDIRRLVATTRWIGENREDLKRKYRFEYKNGERTLVREDGWSAPIHHYNPLPVFA